MEFTADTYRVAAEHRVRDAKALYAAGSYVAAQYLAGVAVECILREYWFRRDREVSSRHDLRDLFVRCGILSGPAADVASLRPSLEAVAVRWANLDRYATDRQLRASLRRTGMHRGIRGDYLKENVRRMVEAAEVVVRIGSDTWHS